jgi:hypothetical protein
MAHNRDARLPRIPGRDQRWRPSTGPEAVQVRDGKAQVPHHDLATPVAGSSPAVPITGKVSPPPGDSFAAEVRMSVMVILEMDGDPDALLAAAAELEARRPTSAVTARVVAPMEGGVIVCTVWESAAARDAYQSEPEHQEALQASGLMAAVTGMRSRVFENAELSLR